MEVLFLGYIGAGPCFECRPCCFIVIVEDGLL